MILGFTGPRDGPTAIQSLWLAAIFGSPSPCISSVPRPDIFHHGACIGSDAAAHWRAIDAEIPLIVVHPPIITKWMMDLCIPLSATMVVNQTHYDVGNTHVIILRARSYHDRDRDIVDAADRVISTPAGEPTPHSGTWFTLNYALSQHKPITLCYPDGEEDTLVNEVKVGKFNSQAWGLRRLISQNGCWVEQDVQGAIYLPHMKIPPDQIPDLVACELRAFELARRLNDD